MFHSLKVMDLIGKREIVYFVDADDTADVAALKLRNFRVRTTGVMKNGKLVGVVGHSDFSTKVVATSRKPSEVRVAEVMSVGSHAVGLDTPFYDCLKLMDTNNISHLIILDESGRYYGMLSAKDLHQRLVKELKQQLEITMEYAFGPNAREMMAVNDH